MPSIDTYRKEMSFLGTTIGQAHKINSDLAMDMTWNNSIAARRCYIYDYAHDDQPDKYYGMTYENTTKYAIDAKFIITKYGSVDKDQVEYHLQFRPSQSVFFNEGDELYYYETDYRQKYGTMTFPISLYVDIPDDTGVYHRWLICSKEINNQFIKYSILPCNYRYQWIIQDKDKRLKYQMWGVDRQQLSYSAGVWRDRTFEVGNNVERALLPLNPITETIYYIDDNPKQNLRMIVSAKVKRPNVWRVTKLENTKPRGLLSVTFEQTAFNSDTDYIERDATGNIIGMWADYYLSNIEPVEPDLVPSSNVSCVLSASTNTLKVGGSYRLLTAIFQDENGNNVTSQYIDKIIWKCFINDVEFTDNPDITWLNQTDKNKIKVKLANNKNHLGNVITIFCEADDIVGKLSLEITA